MRRIRRLDETDMQILKAMSKNPRINQVDLASKIGLTQPAISLRLRKLKRLGVLNDYSLIVDPKIINMKMLKIDMYVKNNGEFISKFNRCPMVTNCYTTEDGETSMILMGESRQFLNCMVHKHFENNPNISNLRIKRIVESTRGVNMFLDLDHKMDLPPCGEPPCIECEYYIENGGECVGCPLTKFYKGILRDDAKPVQI